MAGKKWLRLFLARNVELSIRMPKGVKNKDIQRALGYNWIKIKIFEEVLRMELFHEDGNRRIPVENTFNTEETGITNNHKPPKIIATKGRKSVAVTVWVLLVQKMIKLWLLCVVGLQQESIVHHSWYSSAEGSSQIFLTDWCMRGCKPKCLDKRIIVHWVVWSFCPLFSTTTQSKFILAHHRWSCEPYKQFGVNKQSEGKQRQLVDIAGSMGLNLAIHTVFYLEAWPH